MALGTAPLIHKSSTLTPTVPIMNCRHGQNVFTTVYVSRTLPDIVWFGVSLEELDAYACAELDARLLGGRYLIGNIEVTWRTRRQPHPCKRNVSDKESSGRKY